MPKFQPRAHAETHHHIQELIENQEKRSEDRDFHRNRVKDLEERESLIADAKLLIMTEFWCEKCGLDFKAQAVKQIEEDWTANQRIAYYKSKCFKGHWVIRLVTDRHKDSFFTRSKLMAKDRGKHILDTLQPFETGFNTLYGKQYANK